MSKGCIPTSGDSSRKRLGTEVRNSNELPPGSNSERFVGQREGAQPDEKVIYHARSRLLFEPVA